MAHPQNRYQRQLILENFGPEGQEKLGKASVLVVGAGGLGCPALLYLAGAGVGRIGIIDPDVVDITNLQRQVLYATSDTGRMKVRVAAEKLKALNADVTIEEFPVALTRFNAEEMLSRYDIVIDGTDHFATRYLLDDACFLLKKPLVYGAVVKMEGQVSVFHVPDSEGVSAGYRDLFPSPPQNPDAFSCRVGGILGVVPGIIGMYQATEVIKWISGTGQLLSGQLLSINLNTGNSSIFSFAPLPPESLNRPASFDEITAFDYAGFCHSTDSEHEIDAHQFHEMINDESILVVDVRQPGELPVLDVTRSICIPANELIENLDSLRSYKTVIFVCNFGTRSRNALTLFSPMQENVKFYSLKGGLNAL